MFKSVKSFESFIQALDKMSCVVLTAAFTDGPSATHLHRVAPELDVAAAAAPRLPADEGGGSRQWTGVVLRLGSQGGSVGAQAVLLGGAGAGRLRGGQTGGSALQVGAHLAEERERETERSTE